MDERLARLKSPEGAEQFAINVENLGLHELALQARRRAVELRALAHGAETDVEREALEAVYAYERVLSTSKGKKTRASRTWQMIDRLGIIQAVERVVERAQQASGYTTLVSMGMQEMAFEAVVLRHPDVFSPKAIERARQRMAEWAARPTVCPACGAGGVAEFRYGLPDHSPELERDLEAGRVVLGGCCISEGMPEWRCNACGHEWGDLSLNSDGPDS